MSRIFLIPGLGADCRIYKHIRPENFEVIDCNWIIPNENSTLTEYSQQIIYQYNINKNDIVIGNSMGGIVAMEIAKKIPLKKTILISSIKTDSEAPGYFNFFRRYPVYKYLPDEFFTSFEFMTKPLFGKISKRNTQLFMDMVLKTPPKFIRWAMGSILSWRNATIPDNVYHITGDNDLIFPHKNIQNAYIVKGGSHLMIFTKAKEINKLLKEILTS